MVICVFALSLYELVMLSGRELKRIVPGIKREDHLVFSLVPAAVLFSNTFLEDLEKIWALREYIPDPTKPILPHSPSISTNTIQRQKQEFQTS